MKSKLIFYIFILIILIVSIVPKREFFVDSVAIYNKHRPNNKSSGEILRVETNYLKELYALFPETNTELLNMDRCVSVNTTSKEKSIKDIDLSLSKLVFPHHKYEMTITHFNEVEKKIMLDLEKTYLDKNLTQLYGPIYALVFQAPYLRVIDKDCNVRELTAQYNINSYNNLGYYVGKDESGYIPNETHIKCQNVINKIKTNKVRVVVYILYPAYNKQYKLKYLNWDNIKCNMQTLFNQRDFNDKCFIKCKEASDKACGCLNTNKPYSSKCVDNTSGNLVNSGVLYLINGNEASKRVRGTFNTTFFANSSPIQAASTVTIDQKQCDRITSNPYPLF